MIAPEIGDRIEVRFESDGWFPGEVIHVDQHRVQVKYADPEDPGPHWHNLAGRDAIDWRHASKSVWFKKVAPLITHLRYKSVKMVRFLLFVCLLCLIEG